MGWNHQLEKNIEDEIFKFRDDLGDRSVSFS